MVSKRPSELRRRLKAVVENWVDTLDFDEVAVNCSEISVYLDRVEIDENGRTVIYVSCFGTRAYGLDPLLEYLSDDAAEELLRIIQEIRKLQ